MVGIGKKASYCFKSKLLVLMSATVNRDITTPSFLLSTQLNGTHVFPRAPL